MIEIMISVFPFLLLTALFQQSVVADKTIKTTLQHKDNTHHHIVHHVFNNSVADNNVTDHLELCTRHDSCLECLRQPECFWCAETHMCGDYHWSELFPHECKYNEWHYSHCYVQQILFVIVAVVLVLMIAISVCLCCYYWKRLRRLAIRNNDPNAQDTELLVPSSP